MKSITQVIIWGIYIAFPLFIIPVSSETILSSSVFRNTYILKSFISIAFFNFCFYLAIPYYLNTKKYIKFISALSIAIVSFSLISEFIIASYTKNIALNNFENIFVSSSYKVRFILMFIASISLYYYQKYNSIRLEKVKFELQSLKAQINPHFLFNTLNSIYGLSLTKSPQTSESILKLSSVMRYILEAINSKKIALTKELEYITDYIDLQRLRLTAKTKVIFEVDGRIESKSIPPLLFINFIENAFKYGVSNDEETTIDIQFELTKEYIKMTVKNNIPKKPLEQVNSFNLGMRNTKKRLALLLGGDAELSIQNQEKTYTVSLKINLYD
jgi:LytS/YehU family sensor histidine kinase